MEQLVKMQSLHRATWKRKLKKIEGSKLKKIQVSEALETSQVKKIEGCPKLDPEELSDMDIQERPDKRRKAEKIKKPGGTPKQRREQIRATLQPGYYYVSESGKTRMRILHQLGSCWMVRGVDYFSFVHHGTVAPSPETYTKVFKWCASKRPQRNQMSRTLGRPPS